MKNSFSTFEINQISDSGWSIYYCWKVKNVEQIKRKNDLDKLVIEIEQFQVKHMERHSGNDFEKGNISNYECLKQTIKYHIKVNNNWLWFSRSLFMSLSCYQRV